MLSNISELQTYQEFLKSVSIYSKFTVSFTYNFKVGNCHNYI